MSALKEGEDIIEPLRERLVGCVALDEVSDPHELDEDERAKVLVEAGKLIDEETAQAIEDAGIEAVRIRSVLTCEAKRSEEHTSELQSLAYLVCRLLLEKKKNTK